jgi:glycoprotein endo-alpha-1,2-mannosidase
MIPATRKIVVDPRRREFQIIPMRAELHLPMNRGVAASRQSAAIFLKWRLWRWAETPLRFGGSMREHFRRHLPLLLAAAALAVVPVTRGGEPAPGQLPPRDAVQWHAVPRQVLAFYYGWYGNPQVSGNWVHWEKVDESGKQIGSSTHFPRLGAYDSHDPKLIEQHCRWAKEAGLTGFIVSWWRQDDFHDRGLPLMLDAAEKAGLKVTIYFEVVNSRGGLKAEDAAKDVLYLLEKYSRHPAWLKVSGKPVLFVYGRVVGQLKLDGCLQLITEVNQKFPGGAVFVGDQISPKAARLFDGIHTYNPTGSTAGKSEAEIRTWARATYPQWVRTAGTNRIACVTVIPGYDDSKLGRPNPRPNTDRHSGGTYRALWEEAIAANPDWVLVTSWNEWHEGSEIEPSVENGDREHQATKPFAAKFLSFPPRTAANPKP